MYQKEKTFIQYRDYIIPLKYESIDFIPITKSNPPTRVDMLLGTNDDDFVIPLVLANETDELLIEWKKNNYTPVSSRIIYPDTIVTQDYDRTRLNLYLPEKRITVG